MVRVSFAVGILLLTCPCIASAAPPQPAATPRVRVVDLKLNEAASVELCDGAKVQVRLLDLKETRDSVRNAVRIARVQVEIDGQRVWLDSANYQLPITVGRVQVDCPITRGLPANSNREAWGLEKDARLRLWPAGGPLFGPIAFVYPVKQRWFVSSTQMANEPCHVDAAENPKVRNVYYHYGLDFGGAEALTEVVAATDGLVVSRGTQRLPGHEDSPVATRYDVVYLLDAQGWYHRYSHFDSIEGNIQPGVQVKAGQRLGYIGKEGGSGGWTHLHFDIFCRQPSGKWGCQEAYAFVWEAYCRQYSPKLIAVARPHRFVVTGEKVSLDGGKSWSADSKIARYDWMFSDGTKAEGPRVERTYARPGYYSETLQVTDAKGRIDYDFAIVVVIDRAHPDQGVSTLHVTYAPSLQVRAGDEVTFKARAFGTTDGEETWDFGDGSPKATTHSNRHPEQHAKDGYAIITHRYQRPGDYLVRVERTDARGRVAIGRVHVPVHP